MAWVVKNTKFTINFLDDDGATSSETITFQGDEGADAVATWGNGYLPLLAVWTNAAIPSYSVTQTFFDNAYPTAAAASDVEDKALLKFRTANGGTSQLTVPGIKESLLINSGTQKGVYLDLANTAVAALVAALVTGIGGLAPIAGGSGFDLTAILDAYKVNRPSLKSRQRRG